MLEVGPSPWILEGKTLARVYSPHFSYLFNKEFKVLNHKNAQCWDHTFLCLTV